jgi:hypothetical protein
MWVSAYGANAVRSTSVMISLNAIRATLPTSTTALPLPSKSCL